VAEPAALWVKPLAVAIALMVDVALIVKGAEYTCELVVGVVPSVV
jgi:hypothetical protein